jgi:STE24 endopeptidase
MRLAFAEAPLSGLLPVALAASGVLGLLDGFAAARIASPFWRAAAYLGTLALGSGLLGLPFSLYSTFRLERKFGFNTMTPATWILDEAKGLVLGAGIGLFLLWLFFRFMDGTGGLWWLWAAAAFSLLDILFSIVYPLAIAPLFNKFTPLGEGDLAERIGALACRLGFRTSGIFVMDGSKRSRHSNAYFTGLGRVKRVVLYDTLLSALGEEEVLAVLAHEIGHEKKRHVLKMTAASVASAFLAFWLLSLLMRWEGLYAAFGFGSATREASLVLFGLAVSPASFIITPIFSAWSRRHEFEADRFAVAALGDDALGGRTMGDAGDGGALASALVKLGRDNASNLSPHPLYSAWYYSHPPLAERIAAIRDCAARGAAGKPGGA